MTDREKMRAQAIENYIKRLEGKRIAASQEVKDLEDAIWFAKQQLESITNNKEEI